MVMLYIVISMNTYRTKLPGCIKVDNINLDFMLFKLHNVGIMDMDDS